MENPPSVETGSKPKPKKAGLRQKAARIGATALVIGALVGPDNPPTYRIEQPISTIIENFLPEKSSYLDDIQHKLTLADERTGKELQGAGIDLTKEVAIDEVQRMAKETLPYLEETLDIEKANFPPITRGDGNFYYPLGNRIEISGGPLYMKKILFPMNLLTLK